MKSVVVVGTNHGIQRGDRLKDDFKSYLITLCKKNTIKAIAEEINDNADFIVAKKVCDSLGIVHKIIDPNPIEYAALGVKKYDVIEYEIMTKYELDLSPSIDNNTPQDVLNEFKSRIRDEHCRPREVEWLKRIQELNNWPVLVICGSDHFESFCSLLSNNNNIDIIATESNWDG